MARLSGRNSTVDTVGSRWSFLGFTLSLSAVATSKTFRASSSQPHADTSAFKDGENASMFSLFFSPLFFIFYFFYYFIFIFFDPFHSKKKNLQSKQVRFTSVYPIGDVPRRKSLAVCAEWRKRSNLDHAMEPEQRKESRHTDRFKTPGKPGRKKQNKQ
ncbi:hypothetical protein VTO42DRAFT_4984 [Malbranchea cinnamomea]